MKPKNIMLGLVIIISLLSYTQVIAQPAEILPIPSFEQGIKEIFGNKTNVALAVFKAESGGNINSKNYNCIYNDKSTFCKNGDEYKAWSVDCGIAQINVRGKVCPDELMTKEGSLSYIENIYKTQGLRAWVSYTNGLYKKYL